MTAGLAAALAALALVDSTSVGTLLMPVWLLLAPGRVRAGRVLVFLGTVAGFYLLVGVALVLGLAAVLRDLPGLLDSPMVARGQLVVGAALLVGSFAIGRKKVDEHEAPRPGRMVRWRERAMGESGGRSGVGGLVGLALAATALEVATMLPYLAATGLIGSADLTTPERLAVLAAYCLVMVAPALVLLVLRVVARRQAQPVLDRVARWTEKAGGEATAWIVGIVGFLVARDALLRLPGFVDVVAVLDSI